MNVLLSLYDRICRPLSPYGNEPGHLPSYRLLGRTNDGPLHQWPRALIFAVKILSGAAITTGFALALVLTHHRLGVLALVGMTLSILFGVKVSAVLEHRYRADPLDWLCDVVSLGGAGAYTAAAIITSHPINWAILAACFVLWLATYPWSTPR